jgi:hypothetical protein
MPLKLELFGANEGYRSFPILPIVHSAYAHDTSFHTFM